MTKNRVVVLLSALSGPGGIQRLNRVVCRTLGAYHETQDVELRILALHAPPGFYDPNYLPQPVEGFGGDRVRFSLQAVRAVVGADLILNGHVDFAPFAAAGRLTGSPILTLTHGIEVWSPLPAYKRVALAWSNRIWAVSNYTGEQLQLRQGIPQELIHILPNPLDPDFVRRLAAWRASGQQPVPSHLLSITRMDTPDARKGIDEVIEVLPGLLRQTPGLRYVVIGDGDDRPRLQRLAEERGVAQAVHFTGRVSDDAIHAYLAGTQVFVLPSAKEGFGLVFIEAMAHGKPVVGVAHGGVPEVVTHGETGTLVTYGDRDALARALGELLGNASLRDVMGEAGRRRADTVFAYSLFQTRCCELLNSVLRQQGDRTAAAPYLSTQEPMDHVL